MENKKDLEYLNLDMKSKKNFTESGFTLYLTFNQVVNGRWFTQHGANWSGSSSAAENQGRTISFTSTHWNKGDLDSDFDLESWAQQFGITGNYTDSTHYKQYTQHANFEISFYANHGETLPTGLQIVKVQVIEGTIANTECLSDGANNGHSNFQKYGVPADEHFRSVKAYENDVFGAEEMFIFIFVFSIIGASNWQNLCKKANCMQVLIIPEN